MLFGQTGKKVLKKYWLQLGLLAIIIIISGFLATYPIKYIEKLINLAIGNASQKIRLIILTGFIYIALQLASIVFKSLFMYYNQVLEVKIGHELRQNLFKHLLSLPTEFYERRSFGELMVGLIEDSQITVEGFLAPIAYIADSAVKFAFGFYYTWTIDPQITICMLPVGFVLTFFAYRTGNKVKKLATVERKSKTALWEKFDQGIKGIREIQTNLQEQSFHRELDYRGKRLNEDIKRLSRYQIMTSGVNSFIFMAVIGFIMTYGGYRVNLGVLSIGGLSAIMMYNHLLIDPIVNFFNFYQRMQCIFVSGERIGQIFEERTNIQDTEFSYQKKHFDEQITFKNVNFNYQTRKNVLKNVNLRIQKGDTVALVGESGSGKSTLCKLLPRFYDPTEGDIFLDDLNLRDTKIESIRGLVTLVFQDSFLFTGTIRENILFTKPEATDVALSKAVSVSGLDELIEKLPQGLDTVIGDNGFMISGGERQRIALARAILRNPEILILDESTSALDSVTTKEVLQKIKNEYKNKTIILVAHKLTTITDFPKIVVFANGEIVDIGKHEELLIRCSAYRELYKAQFAEEAV